MDTVEDNLFRGMVLVLIVLIFFLVSVRAAVITALTIPLALLFSFIILHAHGISANLLSIGAIDFGIIIDGTVVMVENIYRELAVIVAGLISRLLLGFFVNPVLYEMVAREGDVLQV